MKRLTAVSTRDGFFICSSLANSAALPAKLVEPVSVSIQYRFFTPVTIEFDYLVSLFLLCVSLLLSCLLFFYQRGFIRMTGRYAVELPNPFPSQEKLFSDRGKGCSFGFKKLCHFFVALYVLRGIFVHAVVESFFTRGTLFCPFENHRATELTFLPVLFRG